MQKWVNARWLESELDDLFLSACDGALGIVALEVSIRTLNILHLR